MATAERTPIVVPAVVLAGLEDVRTSGLTNMLDRPRVILFALVAGYNETARWVQEHRDAYARGILGGYVAADTDGSERG